MPFSEPQLDAVPTKYLLALRSFLSHLPQVRMEDADKGLSSFPSRRERNVSPLRVWPQVELKESQLRCHMGEVCGWFWPFLLLSFLVWPSAGASSLSSCQSIKSPPSFLPRPLLPFFSDSSLTSAAVSLTVESKPLKSPCCLGGLLLIGL